MESCCHDPSITSSNNHNSNHSNSSAYSSLTNSSSDINSSDKMATATRINGDHRESSPASSEISSAASLASEHPVQQMRHITDDYNALLKKATGEIRSLASERDDLRNQCEKLLRVNEDLVGEVSKSLKAESALKRENRAVTMANKELFEEAQRLSDEESVWRAEKEKLQKEIRELREEVERVEEKVVRVREREEVSRREEEAKRNKEDREKEEECERLQESNRRLEAQLMSFKSRVKSLEEEKDTLSRRREAAAGENLQLMVDSDELAKKFKTKTAELGRELQVAKDRSAELERECARLRGAVDRHRSREEEGREHGAIGGGEAYGSLVEKNKNLTLWREQLIEKNRMLSEENEKLRIKCQHLEDLMDDEQTDIGDVLELIKNMQHGEGGSIGGGLGSNKTSPKGKVAVGAAGGVAPISKFRDLRL